MTGRAGETVPRPEGLATAAKKNDAAMPAASFFFYGRQFTLPASGGMLSR